MTEIPHILVRRQWIYPDTTIGRVFVNGLDHCYSLEDKVREVPGIPVEEWKVTGSTAIPRGDYKAILSFSNHFQREMVEILGVPGFLGIRIHGGNDASDTEGCIIMARNRPSERTVQGSEESFFTDLLRKHGGRAIVTIEGDPPCKSSTSAFSGSTTPPTS